MREPNAKQILQVVHLAVVEEVEVAMAVVVVMEVEMVLSSVGRGLDKERKREIIRPVMPNDSMAKMVSNAVGSKVCREIDMRG